MVPIQVAANVEALHELNQLRHPRFLVPLHEHDDEDEHNLRGGLAEGLPASGPYP